MNSESKTKVDDLLQEAMNAEIEAQKFYTGAAEKAQSSAGKTFFQELADFEQHHYTKVKGIIESRNKGVKLDVSKPEIAMREIKPEVEGEFEPNKDEIVEVLTLGIKAEKEAQERYNKIADHMDDPEGKEIFKGLSEDERRHHDLLEAQYYQISNKGTIIWE
jgi:rubrerythrin